MIHVLFGPPGVGKTYLGGLIAKSVPSVFFDADVIITEKERMLLQTKKYNQSHRDHFLMRLKSKLIELQTNNDLDVLLTEAFTKNVNRRDFLEYFGDEIAFIEVTADQRLARERVVKRHLAINHVIDLDAFDHIWKEYEKPDFLCHRIDNSDNMAEDDALLHSYLTIAEDLRA